MKLFYELAFPERHTIRTIDEYLDKIRINQGIKNIYRSVYGFRFLTQENRIDYSSVVVDRLFFDLDSENSMKNCKKFHKWLMENNIKHFMVQSSLMKFHVYVMCKVSKLKNPKAAIGNAQRFIAIEAGLSIGNSKEADLDSAVIGDVRRISRVPKTMNVRRGTWCSYITEEILNDEEKLKAVDYSQQKQVYGKNVLDLSNFDGEENYWGMEYMNNTFENVDFNIKDETLKAFPMCIQKILLTPEVATYEQRWRFAIYCRDKGFPKKFADDIAKKYFSKHPRTDILRNNYNHFVKHCVLDLVYRKSSEREAYRFPNCEMLKNENLCPIKDFCDKGNSDFGNLYLR